MAQGNPSAAEAAAARAPPFHTYDTQPDRYAHWKLAFDGPVATLTLDVDEDRGLNPGYKLKLNSYDLGVDIELSDALQRIRFEHPEVRSVIMTSGKERVFCSGANIFMLGTSSHRWKVNFCKFTNETRNGIEDASRHSGLKFIAACNGTTAGGGYELALACDEIWLTDDRSSAVSLPEVPLLGVLPGTGGLTRITDKRRVRRDHADIFCTLVEGVRAERALQWRLIDGHAKPQQFAQKVKERALALAALSDRPGDRPADAKGVHLTPLARTVDATGYRYAHVDVRIDRRGRSATITVSAPDAPPAEGLDPILAAGAAWWPLAMARELDDAILLLRTNEPDIGTWILKTAGDAAHVLAADATLLRHRSHWFVRETIGMLRRTLARLDVTSRTLFALIEPQSCFAGTLLELALAADRSYMLALPDDEATAPKVTLSTLNFGAYPMVNAHARLAARFYGEGDPIARAKDAVGRALAANAALELGLVTAAPDELDWAGEVRVALEERASLSPDALTGMEANLRFGGAETMETRIFGRLSAWQNWIFIRPNAVGEAGALKVFGTGSKPRFNWDRV
jgi:benzoyl-CoA-dihydrodiol lyase